MKYLIFVAAILLSSPLFADNSATIVTAINDEVRVATVTVNNLCVNSGATKCGALQIGESNGFSFALNTSSLTVSNTGVITAISGALGLSTPLILRNSDPRDGNSVGISFQNNTTGGSFAMGRIISSNTAAGDSAGSLILQTRPASVGSFANGILIDSSQRVGVGSAGPAEKLHISSGTIIIDGNGTAPTAGGALCINTARKITKCTSVVDASGNCTCP
jgi:hypothetical protein